MGVCTSAGKGVGKGSGNTQTGKANTQTGDVKFSDINKPGAVFKKSEYEDMVSKFVGGATNFEDIKSAKDVASYVNAEMLRGISETVRVKNEKTGFDTFTDDAKIIKNDIQPVDLYEAKYNKDIDGYILRPKVNRIGLYHSYSKDMAMEHLTNEGYLRSVTKNGVKYHNVITKKRKTAGGRTRYDIMK